MLNSLLSFITFSEDDFGAVAGILLAILVLGGYIAICAAIGKFAKNRGRSFWLLFLISFFNPIIGFIFAALLGESNSFREERIRREARILMEEQQRYNQQNDESQSSYNSNDQ